MKNFFAILAVAIFAVSCSNETDVNTPPSNLRESCSFFDPLDTITNVADQVSWLRANEDSICETYLGCVEKPHLIDESDYNDIVKDYWGTNTPVYTEIELKDLTNFDCGYSNYLKFTADTHHTITFQTTTTFGTTSTCYSIPLFKSIALNNSLPGTTKIKFTQGIKNSNQVIVFYVDGLTAGFYDFSHYPK